MESQSKLDGKMSINSNQIIKSQPTSEEIEACLASLESEEMKDKFVKMDSKEIKKFFADYDSEGMKTYFVEMDAWFVASDSEEMVKSCIRDAIYNLLKCTSADLPSSWEDLMHVSISDYEKLLLEIPIATTVTSNKPISDKVRRNLERKIYSGIINYIGDTYSSPPTDPCVLDRDNCYRYTEFIDKALAALEYHVLLQLQSKLELQNGTEDEKIANLLKSLDN